MQQCVNTRGKGRGRINGPWRLPGESRAPGGAQRTSLRVEWALTSTAHCRHSAQARISKAQARPWALCSRAREPQGLARQAPCARIPWGRSGCLLGAIKDSLQGTFSGRWHSWQVPTTRGIRKLSEVVVLRGAYLEDAQDVSGRHRGHEGTPPEHPLPPRRGSRCPGSFTRVRSRWW